MPRGRKKDEKNGYFYENEEKAFVDFLTEEDAQKKNEIFKQKLLPGFTKMIESIIRRYKLYLPDEDFNDTFNDTMSFLMTKIAHFKPESGFKAYSYCGTICKNHLIGRINNYAKEQKRYLSYEDVDTELGNDIRYAFDNHSMKVGYLTELINNICQEISAMLENPTKFKLKPNEIKTGKALIQLLENWEELFARMGSNKFNKSSILLFLQELTLLPITEIRENMKVFKKKYYILKNIMNE